MGWVQQTANGFFERFSAKTALCRIPFYRNLTKIFNVLETIQGRNGIKIYKPVDNDGHGWSISLDYSDSEGYIPELWTYKWDDTAKTGKIWCGDNTQPWFLRQDGSAYDPPQISGWFDIGTTSQSWYIKLNGDTSVITLENTEPSYADGDYWVEVGHCNGERSWTRKFEGPYQIPVPAGTEDRSIIAWDDVDSEYVSMAMFDTDVDGGTVALGSGTVVTDITKSETDGKLLKVTKGTLGPSGTDTNVALKWESGKWVNSLPVDTSNDEQSGDLTTGARVVTGVKTGGTGKLLQLVTKPLGTMGGGGITGYTETSIPILWQYNTSAHKWQFKKATVLVKDNTTDSTWTDAITFVQFND